MRIGELSEQTGVPTRMLRYYEEQGLLRAGRSTNGYREYDEAAVDHVISVRNLIQAGLTSRLVRVVLDLEQSNATQPVSDCSRSTAQTLRDELDAIDARIDCLQRSRATVRTFLEQSSHADLVDAPAVPAA